MVACNREGGYGGQPCHTSNSIRNLRVTNYPLSARLEIILQVVGQVPTGESASSPPGRGTDDVVRSSSGVGSSGAGEYRSVRPRLRGTISRSSTTAGFSGGSVQGGYVDCSILFDKIVNRRLICLH